MPAPAPVEAPSWPSTPEWPVTPEWPATPDLQYSMTPETTYSEADFCFMEDMLMANPNPVENDIHATQPQLSFRDPFSKKTSLQLDLPHPDYQVLSDFVGGEAVNPLEYPLSEASTDSYFPTVASPPDSPKSSNSSSIAQFNPLRASIAMPTSHCCYRSEERRVGKECPV